MSPSQSVGGKLYPPEYNEIRDAVKRSCEKNLYIELLNRFRQNTMISTIYSNNRIIEPSVEHLIK